MSMDGTGLSMVAVRAAQQQAESARPWAPVVPDGRDHAAGPGGTVPARVRVRAPRTRRALAGALHRAADAVAPRDTVGRLGQPVR